MAILMCKMCGGNLEVKEGMTVARCPYCGTGQTVPKIGDAQRLNIYDRANYYRRNGEYDKAMCLYEQILSEDSTDSEAYWSLVLCRYGVEYVEETPGGARIPTVNRTQFTPVFADDDYRLALRYADKMQRDIYEKEAARIDEIQKGILAVSQREQPYDVFICYKEEDDDGSRTLDSVLANELYNQLTREGFRVFFSRISLEDKLGEAYEPYIFSAINSAKVMVVVGTKPEYFNAVWVKNEWNRYLALMKQGKEKTLIPAYRDMSPYDLPEEFSNLQAQDMSKLGFMQDLVRGIGKIVNSNMEQGANRIFEEIPPLKKPHGSGWGWKRITLCFVILMLVIILPWSGGMYKRWQTNREENAESDDAPGIDGQPPVLQDTVDEQPSVSQGVMDERETVESEWQQDSSASVEGDGAAVTLTGVLEKAAAEIFQMPAKGIPAKQLAKIQWLSVRRSRDFWQVGYSFEGPEEVSEEQLRWVSVPMEEDLDTRCLVLFSGLKKLDVDDVIRAKDIEGLPLESIGAYYGSPAEVTETVSDPLLIKELRFNAGVDNLNGIGQFQNLEILYIDYSEIDDLDELVALKNLKEFSLDCDEKLKDFAVLGKLTALQKLSLDADALRTLNFLGGLKDLERLEIISGNIRTLEGIETCGGLKSLTVVGCENLKDMSAVEQLTGLEELSLELFYGCKQPELGNLSQLKRLSLGMFEDCSFVENLTNLTELHLAGCHPPKGFNLSKLTALKTLSCTSCINMDTGFLKNLSGVEKLDLQGVATFDDISALFGMPGLRELDISGMRCEINFDAVPENPDLEVLRMEGMRLYKNVEIIYENGTVIYADMDEVELDEHTDFIRKFTGLKELYLGKNGLTDISFAADLPRLEVLDISDNYITQLNPLVGLSSLKKVFCAENPIENDKVLRDSVLLIQD